jgi:hypothetical protein
MFNWLKIIFLFPAKVNDKIWGKNKEWGGNSSTLG